MRTQQHQITEGLAEGWGFILSMKGQSHGRAKQGSNMTWRKESLWLLQETLGEASTKARPSTGRLRQLTQVAWTRVVATERATKGRIQNVE